MISDENAKIVDNKYSRTTATTDDDDDETDPAPAAAAPYSILPVSYTHLTLPTKRIV